MPSQLISHSTLYIGKVKTDSPLFSLRLKISLTITMTTIRPDGLRLMKKRRGGGSTWCYHSPPPQPLYERGNGSMPCKARRRPVFPNRSIKELPHYTIYRQNVYPTLSIFSN